MMPESMQDSIKRRYEEALRNNSIVRNGEYAQRMYELSDEEKYKLIVSMMYESITEMSKHLASSFINMDNYILVVKPLEMK